MKKANKINLFNCWKSSLVGFIRGCEDNDVELKVMDSKYVVIHVKDGDDVKFVYENKFFSVDDAFNFFQVRGHEPLIPTMIVKYCEKVGANFNDKVNSEHTQEGLRKVMQMMLLNMEGLPIPETVIVNPLSYEQNREYVLKNISFPMVLKGEGDQGNAVWKIENLEELEDRILPTNKEREADLKTKKVEVFILQQYIPNDHDFRVTMFEGEVLGVIKRISKDGFYNNFCKGADWEVSKISDEEEELCKRAAKVSNVDLAGVDFVRTDDGIKFFEVNKSPMINAKYPEIIIKMLKEKYLSK